MAALDTRKTARKVPPLDAHRRAAQGRAAPCGRPPAEPAPPVPRRAPTRRSSRAQRPGPLQAAALRCPPPEAIEDRRGPAIPLSAGRAAPLRRVAIAGASGRMGRTLIEAVAASPRPAGSPARSTSPAAPRSAATRPPSSAAPAASPSSPTCARGLAGAQVLIDFTRPEGTLAHLAVCRELGVAGRDRHHRLQRRAEGRDRRRQPRTSPS